MYLLLDGTSNLLDLFGSLLGYELHLRRKATKGLGTRASRLQRDAMGKILALSTTELRASHLEGFCRVDTRDVGAGPLLFSVHFLSLARRGEDDAFYD